MIYQFAEKSCHDLIPNPHTYETNPITINILEEIEII